jgi:hypothetical protein
VRRHVKAWSRPLAGILAVLMGSTLAARPADAETSPTPGISNASMAAAVARAAATAPRAALAQGAGTPSATAETTGGFLGSTKGKVAAVLFVAGVGWTIYSTKKDRDPVRSPIR